MKPVFFTFHMQNSTSRQSRKGNTVGLNFRTIMSHSDSELSVRRKIRLREKEEFGDDVSILSDSDVQNWGVTIFKLCLGLLFIGGCAGAIIYCIDNSNKAEKQEEAEKYLPFDRSQMGEGTISIFSRNQAQTKPTFNWKLKWIQDSESRRMVYQVGDGNDWQYTLYLLNDIAFNETRSGCLVASTLNYGAFFKQMGLEYVTKTPSAEEVKIEGSYKTVYIYEGEPQKNAIFYTFPPTLVRGYSSTAQDVMFGWESFFSPANSLFKVEHWLPDMEKLPSDIDVMSMVPKSCLK